MTAFSFRLEKVLALRAAAEAEALRELGRALHAMRQAEGVRDALANRREELLAVLAAHLSGTTIDAGFVNVHHDEVTAVEERLRAAEGRVDVLRREWEQGRELVRRRRAERRALEMLEERERQEFEEVRRREDARLMDEIAAVLHRRDAAGRRTR